VEYVVLVIMCYAHEHLYVLCPCDLQYMNLVTYTGQSRDSHRCMGFIPVSEHTSVIKIEISTLEVRGHDVHVMSDRIYPAPES